MPLRWVCFDVGETLFDERHYWGRWADWLGVPRGLLLAELEEVIRRGAHHREVFARFRPGLDIDVATADRLAAGDDPGFRTEDLFADVRPCFDVLGSAGFRIGIAGNTSTLAEHAVRRAGLPAAFIASSTRWRVAKPDPGFFAELASACSAPPSEIAYVGDRLDNDVLPAQRAGMMGVWLRRGAWARVHREQGATFEVRQTIDSLAELPALLGICPLPHR